MRRLGPLRLVVIILPLAITVVGVASAAASSANISHSYKTSLKLGEGTLVSADSKRSGYVVPANSSNGDRLLGTVVKEDDSLVAVDPDSAKVQVATSGMVNTLVSTVGGDVQVGDQIGISPFSGTGMKADIGSQVAGLAQSSLNKNSPGVTEQTVTDKQGNKQKIYVGFVRMTLSVGESVSAKGVKLNSLQQLAKSLTGRTISTARIILSICVAVIAIVAVVTLIYASIYSSIISIGRNPLARDSIFRTLGTVLSMVLLMAALATGTVFFLLQ